MADSGEHRDLWLWVGGAGLLVTATAAAIGGGFAASRDHYDIWTTPPFFVAYAGVVLAIVGFIGAVRRWRFPFTSPDSPVQDNSTFASRAAQRQQALATAEARRGKTKTLPVIAQEAGGARASAPGISAGGSIDAGGSISAPGDIRAGQPKGDLLVPDPDWRVVSDPDHPDWRVFIYVNLTNAGSDGEFKVKVTGIEWEGDDESRHNPGIHEVPLGWASRKDSKHLAAGEEDRVHLALVTYDAEQRTTELRIDDFNEGDGTPLFTLTAPSGQKSVQRQFTIRCRTYRLGDGTQEFLVDGWVTLTADGLGPVVVASRRVGVAEEGDPRLQSGDQAVR